MIGSPQRRLRRMHNPSVPCHVEFSSASFPAWKRAVLPVILYSAGKQSARKEDGLKRWLRIAGGLVMVLVGLVLVVLPIVPGWWLVIPGLMLLGREFHWARRLLAWAQSRLSKNSVQD